MELRAPTAVKTAQQAIEHAIEAYEVEETVNPDRLKFLRVSSFPFCGTKWLLSYPTAVSGKRKNKFMGSFFTSVGTAVHTGIQAVLDHSPFLIQDWKCFSCGNLHSFVLKPKKCKKCGSLKLAGREHEYKEGFLVGHLDGAILLSGGKITIIDYKTTSVRKMAEKHKLPNVENVRQIEAYAALLKQRGYDIEGWTLIYITRDKASRLYRSSTEFYGNSFEEEYPKVLKRLESYKRNFKAVSTATALGDVARVLNTRRLVSKNTELHQLCEHCPYKSVCVSDKKLLPRIERSIEILASKRV